MLSINEWVRNTPEYPQEIATKPFSEMFEHYYNKHPGSISIAAPRQSGKSTFLLKKFLKDPRNSKYVCFNNSEKRCRQRQVREYHTQDEDVINNIVSVDDHYFGRGNCCEADTIFIDEFDQVHGSRDGFVASLLGRIVSLSTPTGLLSHYDYRYDLFAHKISLPHDWLDAGRAAQVAERNNLPEELFVI